MSNDTPYVLRMDMIKLAQQRASEKFLAEWGSVTKRAELSENPSLLTEVPEYPSTDMIIEEALKIKAFVDKG